MAHRIEVASKIPDTRAQVRAKLLASLVSIVDVYTIDRHFSTSQQKSIISMLANPVMHATGHDVAPKRFSWAIEIGFLPGVTDNVANTTKQSIADLTGQKFA